MTRSYPGQIKYVDCPVCGTRMKVKGRIDGMWEGTCPSCGKYVLE